MIGKIICHYNQAYVNGVNFSQTYSLKAGLNKFKQPGKKSVMAELSQVHECGVFELIRIEEMTISERKRAMESLIFLTEKKDGQIKTCFCANGSTQRP